MWLKKHIMPSEASCLIDMRQYPFDGGHQLVGLGLNACGCRYHRYIWWGVGVGGDKAWERGMTVLPRMPMEETIG